MTPWSKPAGPWPRATDPSVAYDALHHVWLTVSLTFGGSSSALLVSRSADGAHWGRPVTVTQRSGFELDKQWIACDNWPASPFRGRCYVSYDDLQTDEIETQVSQDGGLTWAPPTTAPGFPGRVSINGVYAPGVQPVVRPDGSVVIPYFDVTQFSEIRSTDGGATWQPETPIAPAAYHPHSGLRLAPLPSAAVDGNGAVYLAWSDCSMGVGYAANDILLARSADGVAWDPPVKVPTGAPDSELPGIDAGRSSGGRLALAYYTLRGNALNVAFVASANGGATWTKPLRMRRRPFPVGWTAPTSQGLMVGDYISTSFAGGHAVPVFALASSPRGGNLRESMYAASLPTPR